MDDELDELVVQVRADTTAFAGDIAEMRSTFDTGLLDGFGRAGDVLERGLLSAIRRGTLGFDDLKRVGLQALEAIAKQALDINLGNLLGGASAGNSGIGSLLSGVLGSLFGLPGRAVGGDVSPGRPFLVGERGPEVFVPTSAGRVEANQAARPRDVRVAIDIAQPRGTSAPLALQRSGRQVASAVRRALLP